MFTWISYLLYIEQDFFFNFFFLFKSWSLSLLVATSLKLSKPCSFGKWAEDCANREVEKKKKGDLE